MGGCFNTEEHQWCYQYDVTECLSKRFMGVAILGRMQGGHQLRGQSCSPVGLVQTGLVISSCNLIMGVCHHRGSV